MWEVGGNVDYERFQIEVLAPISLGKDVLYRKYNCAKKMYDLKIFVDIDDVAQKENIRKCNGDNALIRFVNEWIPKENAYFEKYSVKDNCIVINW